MANNLSSKCSSCGYSLVFSPETQTLKCPQCGGSKLIKMTDALNKREYTRQSQVVRNTDSNMLFMCDSCGAKSNINENKISGICPYCGSSNVHQLADAIEFKPDGIIPFQITKDKAREKYRNWLKTRKFVPNKLKNSAKINKMEGVYFPCWNFDFNVNSQISGVGINEHTRTYYRTGPNGTQIPVHDTYTTRHPFSGSRFDNFTNFLQVGNNNISQWELQELGNYGLEKLKVFSPEYLLGFLSSGYETDLHESFKNTKQIAKEEVTSRAKMQFHYDRYESLDVKSDFNSIMWQYIYLPVWICNFKYQKKSYKFLVNGYTGYVSGKVPRSGWKIFGLVAGILAAVGVIGLLIYMFSK